MTKPRETFKTKLIYMLMTNLYFDHAKSKLVGPGCIRDYYGHLRIITTARPALAPWKSGSAPANGKDDLYCLGAVFTSLNESNEPRT